MATKFFRYLVLVFLPCFSLKNVLSQQPAANQAEGFKLFFEKVYLHLDRTYYSSGDDIWFKAYLVNGQNNRPISTSNNLYVELVDPDASIISRIVIRLDSAVGIGDFKLDDSVATGIYRIRAYTNWMRNFGNHFVFEKKIRIANVAPAGSGAVFSAGTAKKEQRKIESKPFSSFSAIQFFPEGGAMVEDVPTVVAFKAVDAAGRSTETRGFIKNGAGDTVAKFSAAHAGMGRFAFTPRKSGDYKVMVQYKAGSSTEVPFPIPLPTGYVMNVTAADTAAVTVSIHTNEATMKLLPSGIVHIAARHAGKSYFKQQIVLSNGAATLNIPTKDFPAGIANITLYDEAMRPYCERLVYMEKETGLLVALAPDKAAYNAKEKATVRLSLHDLKGHPVKTAFPLRLLTTKRINDGAARSNRI